jgi:ATP-binding cassette subfamily B protein
MDTPSILEKKRIPRTPDRPVAFIIYVLKHCTLKLKLLMSFALVVMGAGVGLDTLINSWMLGRIVGVIADTPPERFWGEVRHELILLAVIWTIRNICFRLRECSERVYAPELMNTTRNLLFNRLIQQSQSFLHANFAGVLANHVRRAGDVVGGLHDKFIHNIVPLIVRFTLAGTLLWSVTPMLSWFILGFVVFGIVGAIKTAPKWTKISQAMAEASSRLTGYIVDGISNLSVVQQNAGWREEQNRMRFAQDTLTETYVARMKYVSVFWGTFDVITTFFFCGFMALVAYGWQQGSLSTGDLAMCVALLTSTFGALASTVSLLNSKFDDIGILQDALHKISTPLTVMDKQDARDIHVSQGRVEFRDLYFAYGQGKPVFEGLNISIPPGQKVGLVGVSGAGKTTLCQILVRAYDVQGGGIYIDGQNIAETTQDSLHKSIAVIPQEPILFHRTLAENIRYGRLDATDDEVRAAAKAAAADTFIETLPHGYNTLVGERGVKLSGGQRQRIAIARAIVKKAHILVLDEATSALDSETEKSIQEAMLSAMQGRTTLVIAHRLSTLSYMDRIIVMEEGRVVEDGNFTELLQKNGVFAKLWSLQAGGFLPEKMSG